MDFNKDNLVLGYPWLASNPVINWMKGLMASSMVIRMSGAAKKAPIKPVKAVCIAGMRTVICDHPFLKKGNKLWMQFRKTTILTQLASEAAEKKDVPWDQIVPPQYRKFKRVFDREITQRLPPSWSWDHKITLKEDAPDSLDCKLIHLTLDEDQKMAEFLDKYLEKGYIVCSNSQYASPFFFVKKKDGTL